MPTKEPKMTKAQQAALDHELAVLREARKLINERHLAKSSTCTMPAWEMEHHLATIDYLDEIIEGLLDMGAQDPEDKKPAKSPEKPLPYDDRPDFIGDIIRNH